MIDRYTKTILTVIAASLIWIALQLSVPSAVAERFGTPVLIAGVSTVAAKCIAGHLTYTGGDTGDCVAGW